MINFLLTHHFSELNELHRLSNKINFNVLEKVNQTHATKKIKNSTLQFSQIDNSLDYFKCKNDEGFCFIYGELFDKKKLINKLSILSPNNNFDSLSELFFICRDRLNSNMIDFINGAYTICIVDFKKNQLLIFNDKYGLKPTYYEFDRANKVFRLSSLPRYISEESKKQTLLDLSGLAKLLSIKYIYGSSTLRSGIKNLEPGSFLRFNPSGLMDEQRYLIDTDINSSSFDIYKNNNLPNLFIDSANDHFYGIKKLGLPISGGKDTRALAALSKFHSAENITAFTWGDSNEAEVITAKKIGQYLGIKHLFFDYNPKNYIKDFNNAVHLTDGLFISNWIFRNYLIENIQSSVTGIFDGMSVWGSCFRANQTYNGTNNKHLIQKLMVMNSSKKMMNIIADKKLKNELKDVYNELYEKWVSFQGDKTFSLFNLLENPYLHFRGLSIKHQYIKTRSPLMDYRIADYYLKAPIRYQRYGHLFVKTLLKLDKELSSFPHNKTRLPLSTPLFFNKLVIESLANKWYARFNKISNIMFRKSIIDTGHPPSISPSNNFRDPNVINYFNEILGRYDKNGSGLFDVDQILKLLERHVRKYENNTPILGTIMTYLIWEEQNS
jgi:hypothetical protein